MTTYTILIILVIADIIISSSLLWLIRAQKKAYAKQIRFTHYLLDHLNETIAEYAPHQECQPLAALASSMMRSVYMTEDVFAKFAEILQCDETAIDWVDQNRLTHSIFYTFEHVKNCTNSVLVHDCQYDVDVKIYGIVTGAYIYSAKYETFVKLGDKQYNINSSFTNFYLTDVSLRPFFKDPNQISVQVERG